MTSGTSSTLPLPLCDEDNGWFVASFWNCTCLSLGELSRELDREDRRGLVAVVGGYSPDSGVVLFAAGGLKMLEE
jgi:hypothetical protein